jgi:hypothetical protein
MPRSCSNPGQRLTRIRNGVSPAPVPVSNHPAKGISLTIVFRIFALPFLSDGLSFPDLIVSAAFAMAFFRTIGSWKVAALQKKLRDLPSSN